MVEGLWLRAYSIYSVYSYYSIYSVYSIDSIYSAYGIYSAVGIVVISFGACSLLFFLPFRIFAEDMGYGHYAMLWALCHAIHTIVTIKNYQNKASQSNDWEAALF